MRSLADTVAKSRGSPVPAAARAMLFPELAGDPSVRLADGLLRAPPRGRVAPPILSALLQDAPARILADRAWHDPVLLARAAAARRALVAARAGGAWWHGSANHGLSPGHGYALVVMAEPALADSEPRPGHGVLIAMLDNALAENPAERIVVLAPAHAGKRLGPSLAAARAHGAAVIDRAVDPWPLVERAGRVYSAGGETGFLALLAEIPVSAFAASCYTGWGATDDAPGVPPHPFRRSLDEIFAGICLVATRCRDPFRNTPASFEETLALLADWRRLDETNRRIAVCVGMSFWKRRRIADFVRSSAGVPVFRRTVEGALAAARAAPDGPPGAIAGWASRLPDGLAEAAARDGVPLIRVEDGFIRSVGLGSDFLPPASLVFDRSGMYFDPRRESDLEALLRDAEFPPALLARAERLRATLVAGGITKYNLAATAPSLDLPPERPRILVPGQVEDDLSIRFGAGEIRTNLDLLARVRSANPDAFILYKPHPDVLAGHRKGAVPEAEARRFADIIVRGGATAALLAVADELHTMTSLAGFEALLRSRRVVVYGRPFYAGWGLTIDTPAFDRGRRLSLDQLVAGALILYPRYLDPLTRLPCGPEIIVERLDRPELWRPGPLVLARRLQSAIAGRLGALRAMLSISGSVPARRLRERPRP